MVDIQSPTAEIRRGKKEEEEETGWKYNGLPYHIGRVGSEAERPDERKVVALKRIAEDRKEW